MSLVATALSASGAVAQSATESSQFYVGSALTFSEVTATPGGFNTVGTFSNAFGSDSQDAVGFSFVVGQDNLFQISNDIRVRGELEFNRSGLGTCSGANCTPDPAVGVNEVNFVTNSFPGPPGPSVFFYRVDASSYTAFASVYLDFDLPVFEAPLDLFVGGGVGASHHDVAVYDFVANGTSSDFEFAWHAGGGVKYAVTDSIELIAGARYMNLGTSNTPLGAGAGGNYTLEFEVVEGRVGMNVKLGPLFGN